MEIFLRVFLWISIVNLSYGAQDLMSVVDSGSKIPKYIRDLIKDFNKKDLNVHDVVILNLESESLNLFINEIIMEIPEENPVIVPKLDVRLDDTRLRPASFVIIIANTFDMVSKYKGRT